MPQLSTADHRFSPPRVSVPRDLQRRFRAVLHQDDDQPDGHDRVALDSEVAQPASHADFEEDRSKGHQCQPNVCFWRFVAENQSGQRGGGIRVWRAGGGHPVQVEQRRVQSGHRRPVVEASSEDDGLAFSGCVHKEFAQRADEGEVAQAFYVALLQAASGQHEQFGLHRQGRARPNGGHTIEDRQPTQ